MAYEPDPALHALNRFGLGARPGDRRRLDDPRGWLEAQLEGAPPALAGASSLPSSQEIGAALGELRTVQRADEEQRQRVRRRLRQIVATEASAVLDERVVSDRPFVERLVAFWSNHLCVSVGSKPTVGPLAGLYERQAIRPNVLGKFEDLVLASARHPAMLTYLDNVQSVGPNSQAGKMTARRGRERGLNENYARELLELHTLGVDGGYGQEDVVELARALTGWTIAGIAERGRRLRRAESSGRGGPRGMGRGGRPGGGRAGGRGRGPGSRPGAVGRGMGRDRPSGRDDGSSEGMGLAGNLPDFEFFPLIHEPGTKKILGKRYSQGGEAEGAAAIRDLCRHPSTAHFVATKLVRHFVADDPPAAAVDRIATTFTESGGDLRAVSQGLVRLDAAWDPEAGLRRKLRTPQDWMVAALRAFDASDAPRQLAPILIQLRHPLWSPPAPKGYGDTVREWADPDGLMNRAELAQSIAERLTDRMGGPRARGRGTDPARLLEVVQVAADSPLPDLLSDRDLPLRERLALALGGPDFQWR